MKHPRRYPVPRPTEREALGAAARRPIEPVPTPVLFACLLAAYAVRDREGMRLFAHALARRGGA
ncbi:hypothetical protein [Streptomyces sp. UG1]|uniref:hypothetical protein n=1 Tax=Streptomyces sp. UG1 TaxID=3417652 RepID=UPI003CF33329